MATILGETWKWYHVALGITENAMVPGSDLMLTGLIFLLSTDGAEAGSRDCQQEVFHHNRRPGNRSRSRFQGPYWTRMIWIPFWGSCQALSEWMSRDRCNSVCDLRLIRAEPKAIPTWKPQCKLKKFGFEGMVTRVAGGKDGYCRVVCPVKGKCRESHPNGWLNHHKYLLSGKSNGECNEVLTETGTSATNHELTFWGRISADGSALGLLGVSLV